MTVMPKSRLRERGFALLIVLWTLGLLGLLLISVLGTASQQARAAGNFRQAAETQAAADGAIHRAILDLLMRRAGPTETIRVGGIPVVVSIVSEDGKINPNNAPPELLAAMLRLVGLDRGAADRVAAAIVDWRGEGDRSTAERAAPYRAAGRAFGPPGQPFHSLDELGYVLGVTPEIFAALAPHMSVYQDGFVDRAHADPLVAQALFESNGGAGDPAAAPGDAPDLTVVVISARAGVPGRGEAGRRAVVRISPRDSEKPFQIVRWGEPGQT